MNRSPAFDICIAVGWVIAALLNWHHQGYLHWSQILVYAVAIVSFVVFAIVDKKKNHKEWQKWQNRNKKPDDQAEDA